MTPAEAGVTVVTVDDLAIGLAFCVHPSCRCELVRDSETTAEVEARLHWWLASDEDRGEA